jgi:hypothetical protein
VILGVGGLLGNVWGDTGLLLKGSDGILLEIATSWTQVGVLSVVLLMVAQNVVKGLAGIFLGI